MLHNSTYFRGISLYIVLSLIVICSGVQSQSSYHSIEKLLKEGKIIEAESELNAIQSDDAEYHKLQGDIFLKKGDHHKAQENYLRVISLLENKGNSKHLTDSYCQLGFTQWSMGNHQEALKYHNKVLSIHKANKNKKGIAATTNNLGLTYSNLDKQKALEYYQKALNLYSVLYFTGDIRIAQTHTNMGIIDRQMGSYKVALSHFEKALLILDKLYGKIHPTTAFVYSNIGLVHYQSGKYTEALNFQKKALTIYKQLYGKKHPEIASTHNYLGNIYLKQSEHLVALKHYQEAICANIPGYSEKSIYKATPITQYYNPDLLVASLQHKAHAFEVMHYDKTLKKKDLISALNNIHSCDTLIDNIRRLKTNDADKISLGTRAKEIYEDGIRISANLAEVSWKKTPYLTRAFYFAEKSKSSVLLDAIADTQAKSYADIPDSVLSKEHRLQTDISYFKHQIAKNTENSYIQQAKEQLFLLEIEYVNFINNLEKKYPKYYNLKYNVSIPSVSKLRKSLSENEALISYFISKKDNKIFIFYLSKSKFKMKSETITSIFDKYVVGYRNAIYYQVKSIYAQTATYLHKVLMPPIEKNVQSLIIIPSGKLGLIPFEALLTKSVKDKNTDYNNLPYLLNKYNIKSQYASALLFQPKYKNKLTNTASLFAPISFESHNLPNLPGTATEISKLNELFINNEIKTNAYTYRDAIEKNIKSQQVANCKYLHFATHGVVDENSPELSQLYLASSEHDDGNLHTGEIYNLKINAELVTLSACQTGLGKIFEGEGIVGLTRSLIYAGASNMLVSLWKVSDRSTADLMVRFYANILSNNHYSTGLQQAKKSLIKSKKYSAPYYWSPFILIGQ